MVGKTLFYVDNVFVDCVGMCGWCEGSPDDSFMDGKIVKNVMAEIKRTYNEFKIKGHYTESECGEWGDPVEMYRQHLSAWEKVIKLAERYPEARMSQV